MDKKVPQSKNLNKDLVKGRSDFREKVTIYGVEGGSIMPCSRHASQLIKSPSGPQGGLDRIDHAWRMGWISSDVDAAKELYAKVLAELPDKCPECGSSGT